MSLDVTIIYKKPKMVKYNATHAACGSTFMIVPDDAPTEETEWSANITHNMSRMALQVPICVKYRNKEYKGTLYDYVWEPGANLIYLPLSCNQDCPRRPPCILSAKEQIHHMNPIRLRD